jgi:hypothetical protein
MRLKVLQRLTKVLFGLYALPSARMPRLLQLPYRYLGFGRYVFDDEQAY